MGFNYVLVSEICYLTVVVIFSGKNWKIPCQI